MVVSAGSSVLRMHYCSPSPSSSAGARSSDGGEALLAEAPRLLVGGCLVGRHVVCSAVRAGGVVGRAFLTLLAEAPSLLVGGLGKAPRLLVVGWVGG